MSSYVGKIFEHTRPDAPTASVSRASSQPGVADRTADFRFPPAGASLCRLARMSEAARDVPADSDAVRAAVANARRGVITHLTIAGERVAAIVPESVVDALRAAEDAEDAAEADAAWDEPGESIPLDDLEAEFGH
jgi:hypothetical protein